ncbi:MAG: hypothetical protein LBP40_04975 [Campylobacteraceae bacterium]|jgi:hypothetical protein|nr:hypothetical protein [Campylobacteraceae bacterium]
MKNTIKLFAATLVCGAVLVGCGGGGSDGGDENNPANPSISFSDVEGAFRAFPSVTASIIMIEKDKQYNVTQSAFDDFNATVLTPNNYTLGGNGWFLRNDLTTQIYYGIHYDSTTDILTLAIAANGLSDFSILNDNVFDDEFGTIDGTLKEALLLTLYNGDISDKYDDYAVSSSYLSGQGFSCSSSSGDWTCSKSDDLFKYGWETLDGASYIHSITVK